MTTRPGPPVRPGPVESWTRLTWVGEIDGFSVEPLESTLRVLCEREALLLEVDLSQVTFIDCAGLSPLLRAQARLPGRLRLFDPSHPVSSLLERLDLRSVFTVVVPILPVVPTALRQSGDHVTEFIEAVPRALSDRATIEQAKGVLMGSHGCDAAAAWQLLRSMARAHDVRIRVMARMLLDDASGGPGARRPSPGRNSTSDDITDDVLAEFARSGPRPIDP